MHSPIPIHPGTVGISVNTPLSFYEQIIHAAISHASFLIVVLIVSIALFIASYNQNPETKKSLGNFLSLGVLCLLFSAIMLAIFRILFVIGSNPKTFFEANFTTALGTFFSGVGGIAVAYATFLLVKVTGRLKTATEMQTYSTTAPQIQLWAYLEHDPKTEEESRSITLISPPYAYTDQESSDREFMAWTNRHALLQNSTLPHAQDTPREAAASNPNSDSMQPISISAESNPSGQVLAPHYLVIAFANIQKAGGYYALATDVTATITLFFRKTSAVDANIEDANDGESIHSIRRTLETGLLMADTIVPIKAFRIDALPSFAFSISDIGYKNHKGGTCRLATGVQGGLYTREQGLKLNFGKFEPGINEVPS